MFAAILSIILFASISVTLLQRLEQRIFRPEMRSACDTPRNQPQEGELITGREEPAVRVVDVTMDFAGGVRALEDVSFALPKGELRASSVPAAAADSPRSRSSRA